jgi:hypothetical protein
MRYFVLKKDVLERVAQASEHTAVPLPSFFVVLVPTLCCQLRLYSLRLFAGSV